MIEQNAVTNAGIYKGPASGVSSITRQVAGSAPNLSAASKKMSGAGFPLVTSQPVVTERKLSNIPLCQGLVKITRRVKSCHLNQ